jgi:hypothetical protein
MFQHCQRRGFWLFEERFDGAPGIVDGLISGSSLADGVADF